MKYLLCILGLVFIVRQSLGIEQTTALRRALLAGYEKDAKPDGKVETKVGLRVTTMDLCAHRQVLILRTKCLTRNDTLKMSHSKCLIKNVSFENVSLKYLTKMSHSKCLNKKCHTQNVSLKYLSKMSHSKYLTKNVSLEMSHSKCLNQILSKSSHSKLSHSQSKCFKNVSKNDFS